MTPKSITEKGNIIDAYRFAFLIYIRYLISLRSVLMLQIIRRLAQDDSSLQGIAENQDQSLDHQLVKLWSKILNHGWSDHCTTMGIDRLYKIGGATWLVTSLVKVPIALKKLMIT